MALTNVLLLSQIAGYVIASILSLCVLVPMSMNQDEFKGNCLLFSTGIWQETDGQFNVDWASKAYCNYTIFLNLLTFIVSAVQIYRLSMYAYHSRDSSFLSAFIDVVTCILLGGLTVIGALMITLGFMVWCDNMTQRFPSCEVAAGRAIDKKDNIDTSGFYIELGAAQFGAWGSFACWVGLGVFALLKLCRYHQLENIRVSMYHERQRLVNASGSNSPGSSLERGTTPPTQSSLEKEISPPDEDAITSKHSTSVEIKDQSRDISKPTSSPVDFETT